MPKTDLERIMFRPRDRMAQHGNSANPPSLFTVYPTPPSDTVDPQSLLHYWNTPVTRAPP